jgi:predicted lipoprotein with Yx(FWY)xxD motif
MMACCSELMMGHAKDALSARNSEADVGSVLGERNGITVGTLEGKQVGMSTGRETGRFRWPSARGRRWLGTWSR